LLGSSDVSNIQIATWRGSPSTKMADIMHVNPLPNSLNTNLTSSSSNSATDSNNSINKYPATLASSNAQENVEENDRLEESSNDTIPIMAVVHMRLAVPKILETIARGEYQLPNNNNNNNSNRRCVQN